MEQEISQIESWENPANSWPPPVTLTVLHGQCFRVIAQETAALSGAFPDWLQ